MQSKVILAGTPEFAAEIFKPFIEKFKGCISAILTQPDKPKGRGQKIIISPVKKLALEYNLPCLQPENFKQPQALNQIEDLNPDLIIVVAYGIILPDKFLKIPKLGCINLHGSLLPLLRGAAPIQSAILNDQKLTGITLMQLVRKMDAGPMLAQQSCEISATDTTLSLSKKLIEIGRNILIEYFPKIIAQEIVAIEQNHELATYAHKISKDDGKINWEESASLIVRKIRAFNPWPISFFNVKEHNNIRIIEAEVFASKIDSNIKPGTVLNLDKKNGIVISCGSQTAIKINKIQLPGSKPISFKDYLNANKLNLSVNEII